MDWENHLEKILSKKWKKNSKNQSENAACEQKTTTEKPNFCSTPFSHYFNIRAEKCTPQNHSFLRSTSCFDMTKLLEFDFKYHENVWTNLLKKKGPIQFKFFELLKIGAL